MMRYNQGSLQNKEAECALGSFWLIVQGSNICVFLLYSMYLFIELFAALVLHRYV